MALEHHPVQNSEVYLLNSSHAPSIPPPSPPSPATPCERSLSPPLDDLISITPPEIGSACPTYEERLSSAVHVIGTEATALSHLTRLYETDPVARGGFNSAVEAITRTKREGGKLVISGIGKSGLIANKLVATMKSLGIPVDFLHPTEALHGDLGSIGKHDTILLITFSGSTSELLTLLPHLNQNLPLIVMCGKTHPSQCEIVNHRPDTILLPAPIHITETLAFGFPSPTISTTVALALGDALAVVIAGELHINVSAVFAKNHPGGAIGVAYRGPQKVSDITISVSQITEIGNLAVTGAQVLMSAYRSETGWIRFGNEIVVPPRRIKRLSPADDMDEAAQCIKGLMVPRNEWIEIPADTQIHSAKEWISSMRLSSSSQYSDDAILVTMVDGDVSGVMEIADLMNA